MANIKSQIKRDRQNKKLRGRNAAVKSELKTTQKKVQAAVADGDVEAAQTRARQAARELDQAASKGILHKKTAARRKSRLVRAANRTAAS